MLWHPLHMPPAQTAGHGGCFDTGSTKSQLMQKRQLQERQPKQKKSWSRTVFIPILVLLALATT
jgi:hypothetical protein